ncbi:MAG: hypothetical protein ABIG34_03030 [Candidatus Peregrinibacteria bacterium]
MKKRTSVRLYKGVEAPLYFHLVGIAEGHQVRIARERDWSVFHIPDHWESPVIMAWNEPGHERLFATCLSEDLSTHDMALKLIERLIDAEWKTHHHECGGVTIPLVAHDKFVIVPEEGELEEEKGALLVVEPPCLLWYEHQSDDNGHAASIAATILIR